MLMFVERACNHVAIALRHSMFVISKIYYVTFFFVFQTQIK